MGDTVPPRLFGAIFSAQEMSKVWGQMNERGWTRDQSFSASLREGVESDIQDFLHALPVVPALYGRPFNPNGVIFLHGQVRTPHRSLEPALQCAVITVSLLLGSWQGAGMANRNSVVPEV